MGLTQGPSRRLHTVASSGGRCEMPTAGTHGMICPHEVSSRSEERLLEV